MIMYDYDGWLMIKITNIHMEIIMIICRYLQLFCVTMCVYYVRLWAAKTVPCRDWRSEFFAKVLQLSPFGFGDEARVRCDAVGVKLRQDLRNRSKIYIDF
jgi:hypothetical protein